MSCDLEPIVSLNVGGKKFTTSRETLCKVCCDPLRHWLPFLLRIECRAAAHFTLSLTQEVVLGVFTSCFERLTRPKGLFRLPKFNTYSY